MEIFPEKGKQFAKKSTHGTLIILYEYKIATSAAIFGSSTMYRQLDVQLPRLIMPIRLHETRKKINLPVNNRLPLEALVISKKINL